MSGKTARYDPHYVEMDTVEPDFAAVPMRNILQGVQAVYFSKGIGSKCMEDARKGT